jgi:hypothetical protein
MAAALPNANILVEKRRRLDQLQLRQARAGINTPPEVSNEILDIQRELAAAAPTTVAESHDILYDLIQECRADVRRLYWLLPLLLLLVIIAVKL